MWRLSPEQAAFAIGPLSGSVKPVRPDQGIEDLAIDGLRWEGARWLQVDLPAASPDQVQVAEAYVRDRDLVATYAPLPPHTVQPQVYWRLRSSPEHRAAGLELIVSVQTSLLFSEPKTTIGCRFAPPADGAWEMQPVLEGASQTMGLIAAQAPHPQYVLLQFIHPSDFHSLQEETMADGSRRLSVRLFQEHLEKGVIRRARAWAWIVPGDRWQATAADLSAMVCSEPPPLTV